MPEVAKWREFAFYCPKECGGRVSEDIRFFVTDMAEVVVCGLCKDCGASGMKFVPIVDLLTNAPRAVIN
jgi:hypothetical protein